MKNLMTAMTLMVFTLAFGLAYADEFPTMDSNKDIGTVLYETSPTHETVIGKSVAADVREDIGTTLYNDAFRMDNSMVADLGAKGSAAGGLAKEDENSRIWDRILGAPGGSDLP